MKGREIRESLDQIEPETGAKERMYRNIMKKTEAAAEKAKSAQTGKKTAVVPLQIMKIALPVAACVCIAVLGTLHFAPADPQLSSTSPLELYTSPYETVDSAADFQNIGISLDAPDGAENTEYTIIGGNTASVDFIFEGYAYTLRASKQGGDFSGVSGDTLSSEQLDSMTDAVIYQIAGMPDTFWKVSWTDGTVYYFLSNTDGASEDAVKAAAMLLIAQTQS